MLVDLSPLLGGGRGDAIRVAGVSVGDAAARIDRRALTGAEENDPVEPRTFQGGSVYRTAADGTLVEVPLAERVEATLDRGGVLRCGDIALQVEGGLVEGIFVRGRSLETLGFAREADIARLLGTAEGHERHLGWRLHHYPSRALVVAWHGRDGRVEHVALGPDPWQEPHLGAPALLSEILAGFAALAPGGWAEPPDGSARVRHQRIAALARALDLGTVADLVAGRFLKDPVSPARRRVLEQIAAVGPASGPVRLYTAGWVFTHLLRYRRDVHVVVHASAGWLECSDPALLGMIVTQNRIGTQLTALMADVDRWLCALMDPEGWTYELRLLIARHGWPDVDLRELERDEL